MPHSTNVTDSLPVGTFSPSENINAMNIKLSIIEAVSSFTRPPHLVFKALRI
jgi:hypothetical protein